MYFRKYYKHKGQLQLDVGSFAAALEYACDLQVEVVGKPSPSFFNTALRDMGVQADEVSTFNPKTQVHGVLRSKVGS